MKKIHSAANRPQSVRVSAEFLSGFIDAQCGKIVTVDYVSADGTVKTMNGRLGVKRYVSGMTNRPQRAPYLMTVYKMQAASVAGGSAKHYRSVRRDSIIAIRAGHVQLTLA